MNGIRPELAKALDELAKAKTRFGSDGDSLMAKGSTADASNEAAAHGPEVGDLAVTKTTPVSSETIKSLIAANWVGPDTALAAEASISPSSLADMKANGTKAGNRNFHKLCIALKVDARKAAMGLLTARPASDAGRRQALHAMLDHLIDTGDEETIGRIMQGLMKTAD